MINVSFQTTSAICRFIESFDENYAVEDGKLAIDEGNSKRVLAMFLN